MIEAEWWDYDDVDEMAGAVAGDVVAEKIGRWAVEFQADVKPAGTL